MEYLDSVCDSYQDTDREWNLICPGSTCESSTSGILSL